VFVTTGVVDKNSLPDRQVSRHNAPTNASLTNAHDATLLSLRNSTTMTATSLRGTFSAKTGGSTGLVPKEDASRHELVGGLKDTQSFWTLTLFAIGGLALALPGLAISKFARR
jgi:hypothetical protein